jgi:predicted alpha-1,2-mannosidase
MKFVLPFILLVFETFISAAQQKSPVDYVNPYIGTARSVQATVWASEGATFPGVLLPFGMVQIAPDRYSFTDTVIRSFSILNHYSGWYAYGNFHLMSGIEKSDSGLFPKPAVFNHEDEITSPYYYRVKMGDSLETEYTATTRSAFFRFTFPASSSAHIFLFDLENIKISDAGTVSGRSHGFYFTIIFNKPFVSSEAIRDGRKINFSDSVLKENGVVFNFQTGNNEVVGMRIGFSKSSVAGAQSNLQREIPNWDFPQLCLDNRKKWEAHLGQIQVKGGTDAQKHIFYTALYHSSFIPSLLSDVDSAAVFTPLYPWDTYRSEHPLLTILHPDLESEMIHSVLNDADKTGWLPTGNMTGNHNVELILDGYRKGLRNIDVNKTLLVIRKSLMEAPYARRQMADFVTTGYVPAHIANSVTHTLEFAYNDWALAEFINSSGTKDAYLSDLKILNRQSRAYRNLYDADSGFMRAKTISGEWVTGGYSEGTQWTYSWFVPHDVKGLINLMGGNKKFTDKLSICFEDGHYVHDNEPPLHYSYLFDFSGAPWKTQLWTRSITEKSYQNVPGGLPGNDDLGALSSWYIFSAMGFYPVTPGRPVYEIGSPVFNEIRIHLNNGKNFTIRARHNSAKNKFIQSAKIDGIPLDRPWFTHDDILHGKTIVFEMGAQPNKSWAALTKNAPPSMTKGMPDFSFSHFKISTTVLEANQSAQISVDVRNKGNAMGTVELALFDNKKKIKSVYKILDTGAGENIIVPFRLYKSGLHELGINGIKTKTVEVLKSTAAFIYSPLQAPLQPFIVAGDSCIFFEKIKNTGGEKGTVTLRFYVNQKLADSAKITLSPGEEKNTAFNFSGFPIGLYQVRIEGQESLLMRVIGKRVNQYPDSILLKNLKNILALDFENATKFIVPDRSGLNNNAMVRGNPKWVDGLFDKAIQTDAIRGNYLELQKTESLEKLAHSKEMTMMCWIYPMEEMNFADIISKGEWTTLQVKGGNSIVNFYTEGWEGHEAYAEVPSNWNRHWHHITGVFDNGYLKLYIDGNLSATKKAESRNPKGETGLKDYSNWPWNIGRNAQVPIYFFNGYIEDVMMFAKALDPKQITELMFHEYH